MILPTITLFTYSVGNKLISPSYTHNTYYASKKNAVKLAAPYLDFLTEINLNEAGISNGDNNNPIQEMTLTAFTSLSTTIPKSGETVNFSVGSALMGKVILSATSAVTDSTGRCYITIKSASGFPYEQGIIFAKWTPSWDTSAHLTSQITITLASLPLTDIPPPIEISLVSPSNPLTYSDDSLPYISNYTSQSRYDWFMAGKISFTIVGLLSQISWSPVSIPPEDSAWGQMVDLQFPLGKVIWFNENHLDPNPFTNGFHGVAASQRHNLRQVANHELGHALGLGHIGSLPSIMFPAPQGFFFSGNQTPQAFDKSVLSGVYPQPQ